MSSNVSAEQLDGRSRQVYRGANRQRCPRAKNHRAVHRVLILDFKENLFKSSLLFDCIKKKYSAKNNE